MNLFNSEKSRLKKVTKNGLAIKNIKDPSEDVKLAAVKQNGTAIQYIKNPSEKIQLAAIIQTPEAILYIKNPTKKVYIKSTNDSFERIENLLNQYGNNLDAIHKGEKKLLNH